MDVEPHSKFFVALKAEIANDALKYLAGLFLWEALLSLVMMTLPGVIPNVVQHFGLQIYLAISLLFLFRRGWRPLTTLNGRGLLLGFVFFVLYFGILKILDHFYFAWYPDVAASAVKVEWDQRLLLMSICAPFLEELFFRDVLVRAFHQVFRSLAWSVVLSSAIFMLAHMSLYPGAFFLGILSAILMIVTRSIYASILFHVISNLSLFFLPHYFPHVFEMLRTGAGLHTFYR